MMRRMLALIVLAGVPGAVSGQEGKRWMEATVQAAFVPLYDGDATVGPYDGRGPSLRLAVVKTARLSPYVEGSFTTTRGSSSIAKPRLVIVAVVAGPRLSRAVLDARVGAGIGMMNVDDTRVLCTIPLCFNEGGGSFNNATLATGVVSATLIAQCLPNVGLRADARLHRPFGGSAAAGASADTRTELAGGLTVRW